MLIVSAARSAVTRTPPGSASKAAVRVADISTVTCMGPPGVVIVVCTVSVNR